MKPDIDTFVYDSARPVVLVDVSPARTNMIYDAVPRPPAQEPVEFVYDTARTNLAVVYDGTRVLQTFDPPTLPGIKVPHNPGPVADEPTIIERKPGDAKGREP